MSKYDPDAPEGAKPSSSQYMSIKDIRVIAVILICLAFIGYPLYQKMKRDGEIKICKGNLEHVSKAVLLYADSNDMRFPPAFIEEVTGSGTPRLEGGYPVTWVSLVRPMISSQGDFGCPVAEQSELCYNVPDKGDEPVASAFGFMAGMSARPTQLLTAPSGTILLAESTNDGVKGTYNPVPFNDLQGKRMTNDGFLVGFDNYPDGNVEPAATTRYMTRLSFFNVPEGDFSNPNVAPRHPGGIFVIFADGRLGRLDQTQVGVKLLHDEPQGYWRNK